MSKLNSLPEKTPLFSHWLQEKGINQHQLHEMTYLTIVTVNKVVNMGIANKSVILLISLVLGLSMEELIEMLKTKKNIHYWEKETISKKKKNNKRK